MSDDFLSMFDDFDYPSEFTQNEPIPPPHPTIIFDNVASAKNYIMYFKKKGMILVDADILRSVRLDSRRKNLSFKVQFFPSE